MWQSYKNYYIMSKNMNIFLPKSHLSRKKVHKEKRSTSLSHRLQLIVSRLDNFYFFKKNKGFKTQITNFENTT